MAGRPAGGAALTVKAAKRSRSARHPGPSQRHDERQAREPVKSPCQQFPQTRGDRGEHGPDDPREERPAFIYRTVISFRFLVFR